MKKQLTAIILISSVIAMILCGCTQKANDSSADEGANTESGSSQTSGNTDSSTKSDASSGSSASDSDKNTQNSTAEKADENSEDGKDAVVYDENGAVIQTPTKYVSTTQMTVDLSDEVLSKTGDSLRLAFITSRKELDDFYNSNKDKYSLDKVDSGSDFKTAVKDLNDVFFESNNAMIIVQSYDKDKGVEIGDTHIEDKGALIDIYKEEPRAPDKAAYVMNIICYSKDDISIMPEVNTLPAGSMYSDESDPDVIVYLDDSEDPAEEDEGPIYVIDEDDNVSVITSQSS